MDSRRRPRVVDNATNQCEVVSYNQNNLPRSGDGRNCESCGQILDSRSLSQGVLGNWDAFPAGVKFDPSDEELLRHLRAEIGIGSEKAHPLIESFIRFLDGEDGICQKHPEHLPGVRKDGSSKHFFHRPAKAYTTGTRKRRKILSDNDEQGVETRWHKTGKTRPVSEDGQTLGWKKIMVLYRNTGTKKSKPEKTNWILHQYHLGQNEEETDGELVVCKVFYQKQPRQCTGGRQAEGAAEMDLVDLNQGSRDISHACVSEVSRGTPVTPRVDMPHRPRSRLASKEVFPDDNNIRGVPAQSSKGSELTVIGMDTPAVHASELTSTPVTQRDQVLKMPNFTDDFRGHISPDVLKPVRSTVPEEMWTDWNNTSYEEVSTSAKSCQNDNDNHIGGMGFDLRLEDERHQEPPFLAGESQQPLQYDDIDDLNFLEFLRCDEDLGGESFPCDLGFDSVTGSPEEPYIMNPNQDYPAVDEILTDTPPALNMDLILSSQEVMDVVFNVHKPSYTSLDNDDSLSST